MPLSTHSLDKEEAPVEHRKHTRKRKPKHTKTTPAHQINHDTQLLEAVPQGKVRVIKRLLDSRANPNHTNEHGHTPLMLACTIADDVTRRETVQLLLRRGANADMQDASRKTVLMSAVQLEDNDIVQCLLDHQCNVKLLDSDGNSALFYAAVRGNNVMVRRLLKALRAQEGDVDQQNVQGLTALIAACQEGHLEVARILVLEGNASLTTRDLDQFMTALEWMRLSGFYSEEEIEFLSPSVQKRSFHRRQRQIRGIKTLADYIVTNDLDGTESPNVFSLKQDGPKEESLPSLTSSQPKSMFGPVKGGKSIFDMPRATMAACTPGYALGCPVPTKPQSHSKSAFLTTKSDLYSSNYLSKRKSFLSKNPRSGCYHSGALEPLEGQRSFDNHIDMDRTGSHGNRKKHDLLPPIER